MNETVNKTRLKAIESAIKNDSAISDGMKGFYERVFEESEFFGLAVLLPYYLGDLLGVGDEVAYGLSLGHAYGWVYFWLRDREVDGEAEEGGEEILGRFAGDVALAKAIEGYVGLGLGSVLPRLYGYMCRSAKAHAVEVGSRFEDIGDVDAVKLDVWNEGLLVDRAAPFLFCVDAQAFLAGMDGVELHSSLSEGVRCFLLAKQLADDVSDWLVDLDNGQLNYVAVALIRDFVAVNGRWPGSVVEVAGYQVYAGVFWEGLEKRVLGFYEQAVRLMPDGRLRDEVLRHFGLSRGLFGLLGEQRERWRGLVDG